MYNINVPLGHASSTPGVQWKVFRTDVGSASYTSLYSASTRPHGFPFVSAWCMYRHGVLWAAEQSNKDAWTYYWDPEGLRVFQTPSPEAGSDVAAIKAGHVSVTPLRAGFLAGLR